MSILFVLIPILAAIAILFGSKARLTALIASGLTLILGLGCFFCWDSDVWSMSPEILSKPSIHLALGFYDGMSLIMVLLSVIVLFTAVFASKAPEGREKLYYSSILLIGAGGLGAFLSTDLFFFYAFHELALIPTFLMIGMLGTGERKEAAWKITIYLALGSIILLAGLIWLVSASGSETWLFKDLLASEIDPKAQTGIAALLIVGFGILISLFPFHSWAAPAYAAAPAPVAMLHAGVLKKFGLFGLIRLYPIVSTGMQDWLGWLIVLLLSNILWVGYVTINQKRLDMMLGNSSVMHMGYIFLAFAALVQAGGAEANPIAIPAAVVLMFAHGISIALLFLLTDVVRQRTGTVELAELGGLAKSAPRLAFLFGLAGMASIGLPGLANFSGEVLVFLSGFENYKGEGFGCVQVATILALWGVVISAVYMLRAYRQTFQGPTVPVTESAKDLNISGQTPAIILAAALLVVGLYPNSLLSLLKKPSCCTGCDQCTEQADK
ncbi:NADH-quinone oxidoreductase subunit M [Akkermansiaceae bacterium]|nr:NADH-quinone oxidoreductase subunit M [Akkermansiaceae bacterium]